ncbi:MAG: acyl-CoA desaturase [Flavobacteriales bacterium]|nr:acyl-CoA desaturase [Flavobacteriales bacterium]
MHFSQFKFDRSTGQDFHKTVNARVNAYFTERHLSKKGGNAIIVKAMAMLSLFIVPYLLLLFGVVEGTAMVLAMWLIMGIGMAGMALGVMHDANHDAMSTSARFNRIMGRIMDFIGGSSRVWKLQHNVLHHTYTNVEGADDDLRGPALLRFSPHQEYLPVHRYQYIYAWLLYPFTTLIRVIYMDYARGWHYMTIGLVKKGPELRKLFLEITAWKLFYIGYIIVLPMVFSSMSPYLIIGGFVLMHMVVGFTFALIFQSAHILPDAEYPEVPEEGKTGGNWAVHQVQTTANFAHGNKLLTWYAGGLNYQIEHHLFPTISHIHYPAISDIVQQTSAQFGLNYRNHPTFVSAIVAHGKMLQKLGNSPGH